MNLDKLIQKSIENKGIDKKDALDLLRIEKRNYLKLLDASSVIRQHFFNNKVRTHILLNAKMGGCPEDCSFCSQSSRAKSGINRYHILDEEKILQAAYKANNCKAYKFCIVTATREPSDVELDVLCNAIKKIKKTTRLRVCTSLGFLTTEKALKLKEAGVDKYNHNLETSERMFGKICSTHSFEDRVTTARIVKNAKLDLCSGGIIGMGETDEDIIKLAFSLKDIEADSIPVNFLNPRPGTPLSKQPLQDPRRCLVVLAVFRFILPDKDIRIAAGREVNLGNLDYLSLRCASSIFSNGYLTTSGRNIHTDIDIIYKNGFELE